MSTTDTRQHVHALIDQLPLAQLIVIKELLSVMIEPVAHSIRRAPLDDEPLTEEETQTIRRSEQWLEENGGRGIPMEEVLADFGLSMSDFPLRRNGD